MSDLITPQSKCYNDPVIITINQDIQDVSFFSTN